MKIIAIEEHCGAAGAGTSRLHEQMATPTGNVAEAREDAPERQHKITLEVAALKPVLTLIAPGSLAHSEMRVGQDAWRLSHARVRWLG
jgi:hypothetical protein